MNDPQLEQLVTAPVVGEPGSSSLMPTVTEEGLKYVSGYVSTQLEEAAITSDKAIIPSQITPESSKVPRPIHEKEVPKLSDIEQNSDFIANIR